MPPPDLVNNDPEFLPEKRLLPETNTELESWDKSQRHGEQGLPVFGEDAISVAFSGRNEPCSATEWAPDEGQFEDPDGPMLLPVSWAATKDITWLRPGDMHLTEPPKFKKLLTKNKSDGDDAEAQEPENPPPFVAKPIKKFAKATNLEFYVRAATNPLHETDAIVYHAVCAINTAKIILANTGQDVWDPIYPKNVQGQPQYNPGGKYIVKLNVMGKDRCVTIDDLMPISEDACLLPRTKDKSEIWPLLLTKALLKALSLPKKPPKEDEEEDENAPKRFFPDLSPRDVYTFFVTCLTGWLPETVPVRSYDALDVIKRRLAKGNIFPCAWGNHTQRRLGVGGASEEQHWDPQRYSLYLLS